MTEAVIETQELTKWYGKQMALDGVTLKVPRGIIGLLGPNGAGKTTLIKCLLQLQPITRGQGRLLGREVGREGRELRKRIGYTPEQDCHVPGMVGCEYVTYCAQLCGLPFQSARQRAHELLDFVGLGQERYRTVDTYSTGFKQRLKLAQALVHDPDLVFMDEPTNGLDPRGQVQMLELIESLWHRHGISVVLSSHLLHDVDRVCDQIVIIGSGRVVIHDTIANLKQRKKATIDVVMKRGHEDVADAFKLQGWPVETLPNGHIRVEHGQRDLSPVLEVMRRLKIAPLELVPSPNALEASFVQALETAR